MKSSMKQLYAAFAENSSCGAAYYDEPITCGSPAAARRNRNTFEQMIENKRTFDGSLEVGLLPDHEVFKPPPTPIRKQQLQKDTPNTVLDTSPEPSIELNAKDLEYPPDERSSNGSGGHQKEEHGPRLPTTPDLNVIEGIEAHQRYPQLVMKKNSFASTSTATTTSNSSGNNSMGRCATPDDIELARGASPLSHEKANELSVNTAVESTNSDGNCTGTSCTNHDGQDITVSGKKNEPNDLGACKNGTRLDSPNSTATSNMFTKDDLNAITPLQISTYLTLDERKKIGTKVLTTKLQKGYNLAAGNLCVVCNLPMMRKSGQWISSCVICPFLKKKVLKKILSSAASSSMGPMVDSIATVPSADLTESTGMSDAHETNRQPTLVVPNKGGTVENGIGEKSSVEKVATTTRNPIVKRGSFIVEAKKSLVDAFKTQTYYQSLKPIADKVASVSEEMKERGIKQCNELDFEGSKEAVAYAGEMMVNRVVLVPEALKYQDSTAMECQGYNFQCELGYGNETVAHAAEILTKKIDCLPESFKQANEMSDHKKDVEVEDTVQDENDGNGLVCNQTIEKIIVEDASADAEEENALPNSSEWKSKPHDLCVQYCGQEEKDNDASMIEEVRNVDCEKSLNDPKVTKPDEEQVEGVGIAGYEDVEGVGDVKDKNQFDDPGVARGNVEQQVKVTKGLDTEAKEKDGVLRKDLHDDVQQQEEMEKENAIASVEPGDAGEAKECSSGYTVPDTAIDGASEHVEVETQVDGPELAQEHLNQDGGEDDIGIPLSPSKDYMKDDVKTEEIQVEESLLSPPKINLLLNWDMALHNSEQEEKKDATASVEPGNTMEVNEYSSGSRAADRARDGTSENIKVGNPLDGPTISIEIPLSPSKDFANDNVKATEVPDEESLSSPPKINLLLN